MPSCLFVAAVPEHLLRPLQRIIKRPEIAPMQERILRPYPHLIRPCLLRINPDQRELQALRSLDGGVVGAEVDSPPSLDLGLGESPAGHFNNKTSQDISYTLLRLQMLAQHYACISDQRHANAFHLNALVVAPVLLSPLE